MGKNATVAIGGVESKGASFREGSIEIPRSGKVYGMIRWLLEISPASELPSGGFQCIFCQNKAAIKGHVQHKDDCDWIVAGKEWADLGEA